MITKNTPQAGQSTLPETLYKETLQRNSIEPHQDLIAVLKKMHFEQLTTGMITASLKEAAKPPSKNQHKSMPEGMYPEVYASALKSAGLIHSPRLAAIVERRHMERLNGNLAVKAYVEFRNRYPNGSDQKQEGDQG